MSQAKAEFRSIRDVFIPIGRAALEGELIVPSGASGIVLFAHGSGSSRHSPRNKYVAETLHGSRVGTLLFDLLTQEEEEEEKYTRHLRFDIDLLARRLIHATKWIKEQDDVKSLPIGYFGSSTGAAAALVAAAELGDQVTVVVSRGGRPDLAGASLPRVKAPTLLIVGGRDDQVISLNLEAHRLLQCDKKVEIVDRATHLFDEPGALEEVARLAAAWFKKHFEAKPRPVETQMKSNAG
ncbi:MAG TPA: alpha/beta family hydrolase [Blastocatellia bacterium]|nr:alpha/beta family hydrolase [Blastocatellia bacterium]